MDYTLKRPPPVNVFVFGSGAGAPALRGGQPVIVGAGTNLLIAAQGPLRCSIENGARGTLCAPITTATTSTPVPVHKEA